MEDVDFPINVMDPVDDAIAKYKAQLGNNPLCVIFTPATAPPESVLYYPRRIKKDAGEEETINGALTSAFPSATILNIGYNYNGAKWDLSDDTAWGKLVLELEGSASSCIDGVASILNIFAEDKWWKALHFDDDRNPCQPGSENGSDEEP